MTIMLFVTHGWYFHQAGLSMVTGPTSLLVALRRQSWFKMTWKIRCTRHRACEPQIGEWLRITVPSGPGRTMCASSTRDCISLICRCKPTPLHSSTSTFNRDTGTGWRIPKLRVAPSDSTRSWQINCSRRMHSHPHSIALPQKPTSRHLSCVGVCANESTRFRPAGRLP